MTRCAAGFGVSMNMKTLSFEKASCLLFGICLALAIHAPAQTFTVLQNFQESNPTSALVQGLDGNFYGTMEGGEIGFEGNVYTLTPGGTYTMIASPCCYSYAPVVLASNGYFYGSTQGGGTALEGNIYKMTASGAESTLYSFCTTTCDDSSGPQGALVQLGNGDIYGTTTSTIFKITLAGELTTVYNFCPGTTCEGSDPTTPSGLMLASDGNFYGLTSGNNSDGTIFKMTPSGTLTTLHTFSGSDGVAPMGPLVQGRNGYLYGATLTGGTGVSRACHVFGFSCGTIFKISTAGGFTTVHEFAGKDGANPSAGLVLATDGNLYGTTYSGGNNINDAGTVFVISPSGAFATLYDFCSQTSCLDGANPAMPLLQATSGVLYGTTRYGGTQTNGTFFSLSRGLPPFVQTIPAQGNAGTNVIILGNDLTSATGVTFHGVSAAFRVISDTEMSATVPSGATTGAVIVTTPSATITSNVPFRVGH
jgi:uncharacterized repeat protein (TIGR03803 family)